MKYKKLGRVRGANRAVAESILKDTEAVRDGV